MATQVDRSDDSNIVVVPNIILTILATVTVVLRFWASKIKGLPWAIDDYLAAAAVSMQYSILAMTLCAVRYGGLGKNVDVALEENPDAAENLLKYLFGFCITYGLASPLVKLTVLCLYRRIFPTRAIHIGTLVLGCLCIGWCIAIELVSIFQCRPIALAWDKSLEGTCIDTILFYLGNSIPNFVMDLAVVILPMPETARLKMSLGKKVVIAGLFSLGGMVVVVSGIRVGTTAAAYRSGLTNPTRQMVDSWLATTLEISVAIIGACLPTLLPVVTLLFGKRRRAPKLNLPRTSSKTPPLFNSLMTIGRPRFTGRISRQHEDASAERLNFEDRLEPNGYNHKMNTQVTSAASQCSDEVLLDTIRVQRDLSWRESNESETDGC